MFDGLMGTFRTIKLRPRQSQCAVCGDNPSITKLIDYQLFCGSKADDKSCSIAILKPEERVTCSEYKAITDAKTLHLLLDVREPVQFEICGFLNATSILNMCSLSTSHVVCVPMKFYKPRKREKAWLVLIMCFYVTHSGKRFCSSYPQQLCFFSK